MSTTTILSILSAIGVAATAYWTVYTNVRDRRRTVAKQNTGIKIDEATYNEIATRAASINSDDMRKVGEFWQEQFDAVVKQVQSQQAWINSAKRRWAQHEVWDAKLAAQVRAHGGTIEPAPTLDPDEDTGPVPTP
jgi:hypothetical protein